MLSSKVLLIPGKVGRSKVSSNQSAENSEYNEYTPGRSSVAPYRYSPLSCWYTLTEIGVDYGARSATNADRWSSPANSATAGKNKGYINISSQE